MPRPRLSVTPGFFRCFSVLAILALGGPAAPSAQAVEPASCPAPRPAQTWKQKIWYRYSFFALRRFFVAELKARPVVDGVAVTELKVNWTWVNVYGGLARGWGAWLFWEDAENPKRFYISCTYNTLQPKDSPRVFQNVTYTCERLSRWKFKLLEVQRYDSPDK